MVRRGLKVPGFCRILVEFERAHVRLYFCNAAGKVLDQEFFALRSPDTPEDAVERAQIIHALTYDSLNYGINGNLQAVKAKWENAINEASRESEEQMSDEYQGLSIWEQMRLLSEWSPLIGFGQKFVLESDPHKKSIIVADACEWLASKTRATKVDDELVSLLSAILKSPQGEALVRWAIAKVDGDQK